MMWSFVPKVVLARRDRFGDVGLRPTNSYDLSAATLRA
jgi:peptide/nickel transport system substrate-binding protein